MCVAIALAKEHDANAVGFERRFAVGRHLFGLLDRLAGAPAEHGVQERLNVAVHYALKMRFAVTGPLVFDALIGMLKVIPNLRAEAGPRLRLILRRPFGFARFFL